MEDKNEKLNKLAQEIVILSRNTLLVNLRFLDRALSQFAYVAVEKSSLLTDGKTIYYDPRHVLKNYQYEKEIPVRDYLHIVMHCVFRHMYMDPTLNRLYWDLACDIAVENVILDLNLKATAVKREQKQRDYLEKLKKKVKHITAESIYRYLVAEQMGPVETTDIRAMFYADNHEIWYMTEKQMARKLGLAQVDEERRQMMQVWADISEQIQVDMETFGKQQGYGGGDLTQNLLEINREKYDYTQFLKKFAAMGEVMKVNDDEFDYIFYTYGLQLYKKMPLIEPLECKEVKRIKEFVIAIDTSGSTSGELVQKFVQKTYNILKSSESFFSKINLHIIQCDAELQEDAKITCQDEFDEYLKTMQIHGLGGTDFRPVFEYVDQLIKNHEFTNLKGLIYFTDGLGKFPACKPDYDTAFVYVDDDYNNPEVPPWAIKLVLQKEEFD